MVDGHPDTGAHYAYSAQTELRSVVDRRYKMIFDVVTRHEQVFDLADDPGELRDRTEALPAERQRLERAFGTWLAAYEGPGTGPRNTGLGEDVERSLRALGYIQ